MGSVDTHNKVKLSGTKLKWFRCDQCEHKTRQKHQLKIHKFLLHTPVDVFKCDACEYKAKRARDLKRHKLVRHTR
jgi:uncharacterized protein YlaI